MTHTEHKLAIVVADALGEVEIALFTLAILVEQGSTEDGDLAATLDGEVDILSGRREVLTIPEERACRFISFTRFKVAIERGMIRKDSVEQARTAEDGAYRCRCRCGC